MRLNEARDCRTLTNSSGAHLRWNVGGGRPRSKTDKIRPVNPKQDILKNAQLLKEKRFANSSAAFYNGYTVDGFYIIDSRIRRKRPCSLFENEFFLSTNACSRTGIYTSRSSPSVQSAISYSVCLKHKSSIAVATLNTAVSLSRQKKPHIWNIMCTHDK